MLGIAIQLSVLPCIIFALVAHNLYTINVPTYRHGACFMAILRALASAESVIFLWANEGRYSEKRK